MDAVIKTYSSSDIVTIEAQGDLTIIGLDGFKRAISDFAGKSESLRIDLRSTDYIDSAAVEQLIFAYKHQTKAGKQLSIVVTAKSQPDLVLHIIKLDTLISITTKAPEAGIA